MWVISLCVMQQIMCIWLIFRLKSTLLMTSKMRRKYTLLGLQRSSLARPHNIDAGVAYELHFYSSMFSRISRIRLKTASLLSQRHIMLLSLDCSNHCSNVHNWQLNRFRALKAAYLPLAM